MVAGLGGFLIGGLLLEVAEPRPLVAGAGVAGLLAVGAVALPVRRAVRAERMGRPRVSNPEPADNDRQEAAAVSEAGAELATPVASR